MEISMYLSSLSGYRNMEISMFIIYVVLHKGTRKFPCMYLSLLPKEHGNFRALYSLCKLGNDQYRMVFTAENKQHHNHLWKMIHILCSYCHFFLTYGKKHSFSLTPATNFTLVGLEHQLLVTIEENSHFLIAPKLYKFVNNTSKKALFCTRF